MRYYDVIIKNPKTGELIQPNYFKGVFPKSSYTSFAKGRSLTAALNVEFSIPFYNYANPLQGAFLRIWGISIQEISQAYDLSMKNIDIFAGMKKGLPLAKPEQSTAPLVQGTIFQSFGNWEGINQSIDMTLIPPVGSDAERINYTFDWQANTPLAQAIETTLKTALPLYELKIAISDELKSNYNQPGSFYPKLSDFSEMIRKLTSASQFKGIKPLPGGEYRGVNITVRGRTVIVYDGTKDYGTHTFEKPKAIAFEDLIGQPTWIGPGTINFRCVLRSDIGVGDHVKLPPSLATPYVLTTTNASFPNAPSRNNSMFKGTFIVTDGIHYGNFRQPDAASWVTSFNAVVSKLETPK